MSKPSKPVKTRVAWCRWDAQRMKNVISHPVVWMVAEPDGHERHFDTKREALDWIEAHERESED